MELSTFTRHCGTRIVSDFWTVNAVPTASKTYVKTFIGIFVDNSDQAKCYKRMKKAYKILYQSPILKRGPGNGNDYFIVIWLNEKP